MLLLLITIMIIMNMQSKLYTIQFSHRPMMDSQSVPEQHLQNPELADFTDFAKFPENTELLEKFKFPDERV